jgi:ketosteroid isomerase-like protein
MNAAQGGAARVSLDSPARPRPAPPARSPAGACLAFVQALADADLARASSGFTREACLITPDATTIHGRSEIASVLAQLIAARTQIGIDPLSEVGAGDVALVRQRWTFASQRPDRIPFAWVSEATIVLRRIEAEWKIALAAPWGAGV